MNEAKIAILGSESEAELIKFNKLCFPKDFWKEDDWQTLCRICDRPDKTIKAIGKCRFIGHDTEKTGKNSDVKAFIQQSGVL